MKTKKMTFNMLAANAPDIKIIDITADGDVTLGVKERLDMKHALQFVQDIVSICFDQEETTYYPEIFDAAVRMATLMHYAGVESPKDVNKAYAVVYGTHIYERICDVIDKEQFMALVDGARKNIEFKRDLLAATSAQKVADLISRVEDVIANLAEITKNVDTDGLVDKMNDITEQINKHHEVLDKAGDNVIIMPLRKEEE